MKASLSPDGSTPILGDETGRRDCGAGKPPGRGTEAGGGGTLPNPGPLGGACTGGCETGAAGADSGIGLEASRGSVVVVGFIVAAAGSSIPSARRRLYPTKQRRGMTRAARLSPPKPRAAARLERRRVR